MCVVTSCIVFLVLHKSSIVRPKMRSQFLIVLLMAEVCGRFALFDLLLDAAMTAAVSVGLFC